MESTTERPDGPVQMGRGPGVRIGPPRRRAWGIVWTVAVVWALFSFLRGDAPVVNDDGMTRLGEFWSASLSPQLSASFLQAIATAAATTLAFAVLGTLLAVPLGLVLGVLSSRVWWTAAAGSRRDRAATATGSLVIRRAVGLPRGMHEAVWGLILIMILGRDPLVGVLAIAIPFGAITAKVYAEVLDESDAGPFRALRAAGSGRLAALCYGLLPATLPALTSYAFYRFECAVRSAVILGMIGAGGLGLHLSLSFMAVQYDEMWTIIYIIIALSAVVDWWGGQLRRRGDARMWSASLVGMSLLAVASVWHLKPERTRWWSEAASQRWAELGERVLPPSLPAGGWQELLLRSVETIQLSILAATLAATLALMVAFVAARTHTSRVRSGLSWAARTLLLVIRAIPPPAWALLVLFVVYPGPLAGALALGIYTFGILGRLFAEVIENIDPGPRQALTLAGGPQLMSFAYATLPAAAGHFVAYGLYRWEVATRESVVVGLVGAGGLGRLLQEQRAGFDLSAMATTVIALVAVSMFVDVVGHTARRSLHIGARPQ